MSEMIERVARAIIAEFQPRKVHEDEARQIARAAIEAMREPTDAMVLAADPHGIIMADFEMGWQAMIDEALK